MARPGQIQFFFLSCLGIWLWTWASGCTLGQPRNALLPDEKSHVVVCKSVDLAIRFPRIFNSSPQCIFKPDSPRSRVTSFTPLLTFAIYDDQSAISVPRGFPFTVLGIECYPPGMLPTETARLFSPAIIASYPDFAATGTQAKEVMKLVGLDPDGASKVIDAVSYSAKDLQVVLWKIPSGDFLWVSLGPPENLKPVETRILSLCPASASIDLDAPANRFFNW